MGAALRVGLSASRGDLDPCAPALTWAGDSCTSSAGKLCLLAAAGVAGGRCCATVAQGFHSDWRAAGGGAAGRCKRQWAMSRAAAHLPAAEAPSAARSSLLHPCLSEHSTAFDH